MPCRACGATVVPVVDLGAQPVGGGFPRPGDPPDELLPLRLGVCRSCGLAQLADPSPAERDDPDAPSPLTSSTMAAHADAFADDLVARGLATPGRRILTLASHGGYLAPLLRARGLTAEILEPDEARAERLAAEGQPVLHADLASPGPGTVAGDGAFDLIVDSYLLAHLDRPREALARLARLLAPGGTLVLEFDDLLATVEGSQWDAIGHGHPVHVSLGWLVREFATVGLAVTDATVQPVYGGALRVFARAGGQRGPSVKARLAREADAGIGTTAGLAPLAGALDRARDEVVAHLRAARVAGLRVAGYGAPGRAITFLNGLGIGPDLLPYVVDRAPAKQGRAIPGVRIPIHPPGVLGDDPPDEVLVLTWNIAPEVRRDLAPVLPRTRFVVAVPVLADVGGDGLPSGGPLAAG